MKNPFSQKTKLAAIGLLGALGLASCGETEAEVNLCEGLKGEEEILCLRPDLAGRVLERNIVYEQLQNSGRSDIDAIKDTVARRSTRVFEFCRNQGNSRALCMDEWLQAEVDQVQIELNQPEVK